MRGHTIFPVLGLFLAAVLGGDVAAVTISGQVVIPASDAGWQPALWDMQVRVEGTGLSAIVDGTTGAFQITEVPAGQVCLLLVENNQDVFTAASKRVQINAATDVTGVAFDLAYHWQELASYPVRWGHADWSHMSAHFVSAQVGFMLFRGNGVSVTPDRVELYRTVNGAQSWELITTWIFDETAYSSGGTFPRREDLTLCFLDADRGVISGGTQHGGVTGFYHTSNGGQSWGFTTLPRPGIAYSCHPQRFARVGDSHLVAAGWVGEHVQGYGSGFWAAIWESTDAGAHWMLASSWTISDSSCSGLGAASDGSAVAFYTPYGIGERQTAVRNAATGEWTITSSDAVVTHSGYGPADVPFVGTTAWVSNSGSLGEGLFRSESSGSIGSWNLISGTRPQYMSFGTIHKGFGLMGGPAHVTYDGGVNWLYQSGGGGYCCHGNDIWAFDATHAIWNETGAGDPNGRRQFFSYVEPWEPDYEITSARVLPDTVVTAGETNVPVASYRLVSHGPVPIVFNGLALRPSSAEAAAPVAFVRLWEDVDANGYYSDGDRFLEGGTFTGGEPLVLSTGGSIVLQQYVPVDLLVTYDIASTAVLGAELAALVNASEAIAVRQDTGDPWPASAPANYPLSSRTLTVGQSVFGDDFEGGLANWLPTTEDPVPDAGYGFQLAMTAGVSGVQSAHIHEDRGHDGNTNNHYLSLAAALSFGEPGTYWLSFYQWYELEPSILLYVETSLDGGQSWSQVSCHGSCDSWVWSSTGGAFRHHVLDLSGLAGESTVLIRFRFDWTSGWYFNGDWWIDDVRVLRVPPAEAGPPDDPGTEPDPTDPEDPPAAEEEPIDSNEPPAEDPQEPEEQVESSGPTEEPDPALRSPVSICGAGVAQGVLLAAAALGVAWRLTSQRRRKA